MRSWVACLFLVGCGGGAVPDTSSDGGFARDAVAVDAGAPLDAGRQVVIQRVSSGLGEVISVVAPFGFWQVMLDRGARGFYGDSSEAMTWPGLRPTSRAVFGGRYWTLADDEAINSLTSSFDLRGEMIVDVPCDGLVALDDDVVVCSAPLGTGRQFSTIDGYTVEEFAWSGPFAGRTVAMWRIPGRREFVTQDEGGRLSAFGLDAHGVVSRLGSESAEPSPRVMGLLGSSLLVDEAGGLISAGWCGDPTGECLTPLGTLGTLEDGERIRGMTAGTDGRLFALVEGEPFVPAAGLCAGPSGCEIQQIDPGTRTIVARARWPEVLGRVSGMTYDPNTDRVLLASGTDCDPGSRCAGWVLFVIAF